MYTLGHPLLSWSIVMWLAVLSRHDLDTRRLPNRLTLIPIVAVLASVVSTPEVIGAVIVAALPYLVGRIIGGCGGGDLKLAVVLGALAADPARAAVLVLAAVTLTLVGMAVRRCRGRGPDAVAHGPALGLAAVAVLPLAV
ncbi:A24 family peptidase [Williamsia sp. CHRR-6]|uniref:A24 family peptidase n=1 Tax=Williamsia sp. CHRR-6 TaxID=2835871 RepID=UPI001BD9F1EF|nr:A24 family peptidase [Williamsia sp. CHRR-6]MBT0568002.1 prepilin peptidase [Williamsia sp. CHRR-6]